MSFLLKHFNNEQKLRGIMVPSLGLIFLGSNYVILLDVGQLIRLNTSFYWLYNR